MITRRCTQRQFLLRPDPETNNAFIYCLVEAAQRAEIDVLLTCAMSNHHHTVIFDRHGRYPEFVEQFHKMFARSQNALRGRWENFWASEQTSVVRLVDRADVIDKIVYAATNPVKDALVSRAHHWPGVNAVAGLLYDHVLSARRPAHFFRNNGKMPLQVELRLTVPPELGAREDFIRELSARIAAAELQFEQVRLAEGRALLGRRGVREQSWRGRPQTEEPRRRLRPRVAATNKWRRREALGQDRTFVRDYAEARACWKAGEPAVFPIGTYWLCRYAGVTATYS